MPRASLVTKLCPRCGREFRTPHPEQRFCSRSCAAQEPRPTRRRAALEPKICRCGRTFVPSTLRVRFCSMSCGNRFGGHFRAKTCPECSTVFETKLAIQIYCSSRCLRNARRARTIRYCQECGSAYNTLDRRRKFCSRQCVMAVARRRRAEQVANWKGGRTLTAKVDGYVRVRAPGHPRTTKKNPYVLEHILVMETVLGRYLRPKERVHHKNGRRQDNRPENLELWKMKDPPGVRSSDYHCPGCACGAAQAAQPNTSSMPSNVSGTAQLPDAAAYPLL